MCGVIYTIWSIVWLNRNRELYCEFIINMDIYLYIDNVLLRRQRIGMEAHYFTASEIIK